MLKTSCLLLIVFCSWHTALLAQGCSDAGFCTMGALKPDQPYNKRIAIRLRSVEIGAYRGTTPLTPVIYVVTADMSFSINNKTSFQIKLPYQTVTGQLGNTAGLGDISLCVTRTVVTTRAFDINISFGAKLASNGANKTEDGLPLPMYYQTSLGSYDGIAGLSFISRKWLLATGIQHAFNQNNNQFLWSAWENSSEDQEYIHRYANSRELSRGTDVMLRVERNFRFSQWNFAFGLLPICRINHDVISNRINERVDQAGTTGLALSALLSAGYNFDVRSGLKLLMGHKLVQRDTNPDGLTREFVSTLSYCYRF